MCELAPGNKEAGAPLATVPSIDNIDNHADILWLITRAVSRYSSYSHVTGTSQTRNYYNLVL